jgi:hypothetical protein
MGNNDGCCKSAEAEVAFNELIRELSGAVDQASYNADAYRNKVNKLDTFSLECEQAELKAAPAGSCKSVDPPDTVLYKLRTIINQLKRSNQKNDEILKHFSTLV